MVRWNGEDLKQKDSIGVTDDSGGSFSGGLQQGYELGSLTDGLVAYFPFDGDVNDKALDNNGTDNTSAGYVSGKVGGQAKDFDGSDDFISGIGSLDTFSFVQNSARFCVTGWVKGSGDFVGNETNQGDKGFISTIQSDGDVRIVLYDGSGSKTIDLVTSSQPVSTSSWDHIAVTGNGSQIKIFVNGTQEASGSVSRFSSGSSSKQLEIGYVHSYSAFEGQMDDIRIYERPLSQPEIQALYQRTSTQKITDKDRLTSGLVGHWPLNEDGAGKAYDLSGNNFDSTSVTGTSTAVGLGGAKARSFDSASSEEVHLDASNFNLSTYSVSFWAYTENFTADGTNGDYFFDSPNNTNRVYMYDSATDKIQSPWGDGLMPVSDWENNSWNLVTLVNHGNGGDVDFYYNGIKQKTLNGSGLTLTPDFISLGGYNYEHLDGNIADFRIYNRPLSKSEVRRLAEMGGLDV